MRDYGKVAPSFWIGATGKALRGDANAQLLALYLMTSPHSNMIGVFHCPVLYMAHETGITFEGASEALRRLVEVGFCTYEGESETVFVHRMAAYQVGESLSPKDNQVKGIQKDFEKMAPELIKQAFYAIYSVAFHLPDLQNTQGQAQAPCKPLASQEQEQEQEQEQDIAAPSAKSPRGTALPKDWELPLDWKTWAEGARPDVDVLIVADSFRDYWVAKPGKDGRKADWLATWRNWVRNQRSGSAQRPQSAAAVGVFV